MQGTAQSSCRWLIASTTRQWTSGPALTAHVHLNIERVLPNDMRPHLSGVCLS